jgi:hypothetical protein
MGSNVKTQKFSKVSAELFKMPTLREPLISCAIFDHILTDFSEGKLETFLIVFKASMRRSFSFFHLVNGRTITFRLGKSGLPDWAFCILARL